MANVDIDEADRFESFEPRMPESWWRRIGFASAALGAAALLFGIALASYDNGGSVLLTTRQAVVELSAATAGFGLSVWGLRRDTRGHRLRSRVLIVTGCAATLAWYVLVSVVY